MLRVVVADDEVKVCQLICALVDWTALDMEIVGVANNGIEALELVEKLRPDLMITDIRMPGCDGLELIQRAKASMPELEFIIVSGFGHFEYAQSAMKYGVSEYLLKPLKKSEFTKILEEMRDRYRKKRQRLSSEEQLCQQLKNNIGKLRASLFIDLLQNNFALDSDLTSINETYRFAFCAGLFELLIVKNDYSFESISPESLTILQNKTAQIMRSALSGVCIEYESYIQQTCIYLIINFTEENRSSVHKQLKAAVNELTIQNIALENAYTTIAMGFITDTISDLNNSLRTAQWAKSQRLLEGTGKLIGCDKAVEGSGISGDLLADFGKDVQQAVELLDTALLQSAVDTLRERTLQAPAITGADLFYIVCRASLLYAISFSSFSPEVDNAEEFSKAFVHKADLCPSAQQLFALLSATLQQSIRSEIQTKQQEEKKPIRQAKSYIQKNYMMPLSLDEVSGVAGFNPTYFSTLFKKETGQNFLEYLLEIRMNKAKELLRESSLSVAEICRKVGYIDLKHFTQNFKKSTGLKPNEFRKLYS